MNTPDTPIENAATVERSGSVVRYRNLQRRDGNVAIGNHADVTPRRSVRLHGVDTNRRADPVAYDRCFAVGGACIWSTYNLRYTGRIVAIGAKTVTIATDVDGSRKRLNMYQFSFYNRHFNAAETAAYNREEMMCI